MGIKSLTVLIITCIAGFSCAPDSERTQQQENIPPLDRELAMKPPMGWNSWDCLGWGATEAEVRSAADYMALHLKHLGYEYIVIDMLWYGDAAASDFEAFVHETIPVKPVYNVDRFGRLFPDTVKFPSSSGRKGFKPLADYIHSLGLKFGLHILRGIPWQAADFNLPVKGT
jgi:alpha-galactosidase